MSSTVGKTKPKLFTLQSVRYAIGTALIGFGQRTTRGWESATDGVLDNGHKFDVAELTWTRRLDLAAEHLPGWKEIDNGTMSIPEARDQFVTLTGAGFTALMGALHAVEEAGGNVDTAIKEAGKVDWRKDDAAFFGGTLVQEGKVLGSRNAFEAASAALAKHLLEQPSVAAPAQQAAVA
jgi:hypothetical protein